MTESPRYRGYHDVGGLPGGPIDLNEYPFEDWQKLSEAVRALLDQKHGLVSLDELRRAFETFGRAQYEHLGFYERRAEALTYLLVEKNVVTLEDIMCRMDKIAASRGYVVDRLNQTVLSRER